MELIGLTHNLCNNPDQILLNQSKYRAKYTYPSPEKVLNLMLFYSGRDHTIIIAKDSLFVDVELEANTTNFYREEQELKQRPRPRLHVVCPSLFEKEA